MVNRAALADESRSEADRRRRVTPLYHPERRTGFDRRRTYPITGALRDEPGRLIAVIVAINLLSALDLVLTLVQLSLGTASEGNPVMGGMLAAGPGVAWLFKAGMILLVSVGLWMGRRQRAVLAVAVFALVVYLAVIAYHVVGLRLAGAV